MLAPVNAYPGCVLGVTGADTGTGTKFAESVPLYSTVGDVLDC